MKTFALTNPRRPMTRRKSVDRTLWKAVGIVSAPAFLRGQNLNNKLNIAFIACGGRGNANLAELTFVPGRATRTGRNPDLDTWHQGDSKPPGWVEAWGRRSCVFMGEKGMLLGNGKLLPEERFKDFQPPPATLPRSPGHWVEWVNYAKGNGPVPGSNFQYSGWTTEANHLGNAGRVGPAERWIQVIGKRIIRIHVKHYSAKPADPAARGNTRPKLLDGDTNWPAVMKALDAAGYTGWGISEQPGDQAADVETALDLARRMDRIFAL